MLIDIRNKIPRLGLKNTFILSSALFLFYPQKTVLHGSLWKTGHTYIIPNQLPGATVLVWDYYEMLPYRPKHWKIKTRLIFSSSHAQSLKFHASQLLWPIFLRCSSIWLCNLFESWVSLRSIFHLNPWCVSVTLLYHTVLKCFKLWIRGE